jgi:ankyrin repeat protein
MTNSMKKELVNTRQRLDSEGFDTELSVLERYLSILGKEIEIGDGEIQRLTRDRDLASVEKNRTIDEHVDSLFQEIKLDLTGHTPGNIAVSGFSFPDGREADILHLLDKTAETRLFGMRQYTILERESIDAILKEQELSLTDLMETTQAIAVGNALSADYILTGTVIEMTRSVTVFARVINVETTSIESVSQVVIHKSKEIVGLLGQSRDIMDLVEQNRLELVKRLIENGVNINKTAADGYAPLDAAILNGNTAMVQLLVDSGADVTSPRRGCAPLNLAARQKRVDIIRLLVNAGADTEALWEGKTALMIATINADVETVQVLLTLGADIEARQEREETTPLMLAVEYGHADVAEILIDAGADVDATAGGLPVLVRAVDPIRSHGANLDIVNALIGAGTDINQTDSEGFTALIRAVVSATPEVVRALLDAGADVDAHDASGNTAIMWAERTGRTNILALLREAADLSSIQSGS